MGQAIGAIATMGAALATTIVKHNRANKASKEAKSLREDQARDQRKLEDERNSRLKNEESAANSRRVRDEARARQKARASAGVGRADTILTSPLGDPGEEATKAEKTILG